MNPENNELHESATAEFKHFPALDGMRGIAVIAVIAYHAGHAAPTIAPLTVNFFLGVDIFFVLSGFLITSILLKEHGKTNTISLKNFYVRRILRLVPAYWAFLIFVYFLGSSFQSVEQNERLYGGYHFTAAFLYLSNWQNIVFISEIPPSLIHLWSLAIEEQYYVIFSLLMWLLIKFRANRRQMLAVVAALIVLVVINRICRVAAGAPLLELSYSTDTRIDGLLIGSLAGMIYMWKILPARAYESNYFKIAAAVSLSTILAIRLVFPSKPVFYQAGFPVFAVAVAVVILYLATSAKTYAHSLLEIRPLCFIGRISYGLYLWNTIGFIFAGNIFTSEPGIVLFGVAMSFALAAISYYKIEEPFLKLKSRFS